MVAGYFFFCFCSVWFCLARLKDDAKLIHTFQIYFSQSFDLGGKWVLMPYLWSLLVNLTFKHLWWLWRRSCLPQYIRLHHYFRMLHFIVIRNRYYIWANYAFLFSCVWAWVLSRNKFSWMIIVTFVSYINNFLKQKREWNMRGIPTHKQIIVMFVENN